MRSLADLASAVLPTEPRVARLDNGLTVCLLAGPGRGLVESALWYPAGARDEPAGQEGIAHFLEHMMFKGSSGYPEGAVDRLTQAAGGTNQAFTTHDATAYQFGFSGDRWQLALELEADRMAGLTLDPSACDREREVILEELAMAEALPWDALERAVAARFYGSHPYGRPVLGRRRALGGIGPGELGSFHRRRYTPDGAVLALAGDLPPDALDRVVAALGAVPPRVRPRRSAPPEPAPPDGMVRLTVAGGSVDRLLIALPGPAADGEHAPAVRLLAAVLGGGRASRLPEKLVEERALFLWLAVELSETELPGMLTVAGEVVPGVPREQAETALWAELDALRRQPPGPEEIRRARRLLVADQLFASQRLGHQAALAAEALTLFDLDHPHRQLRRAMECGREQLAEAAAGYLDPHRSSVVGWSLAGEEPAREGSR